MSKQPSIISYGYNSKGEAVASVSPQPKTVVHYEAVSNGLVDSGVVVAVAEDRTTVATVLSGVTMTYAKQEAARMNAALEADCRSNTVPQ